MIYKSCHLCKWCRKYVIIGDMVHIDCVRRDTSRKKNNYICSLFEGVDVSE